MDDFYTEPFWMDDFEVYNQNEADDYRHEYEDMNGDLYDDDYYYDVQEF